MCVFLKEVKGKKLTDVENLAALERIEVQECDSEPNDNSDVSDNKDDDTLLLPNVDFDELDAKTSNVVALTWTEWQEACMVLTKVCPPSVSLSLTHLLHPLSFSFTWK